MNNQTELIYEELKDLNNNSVVFSKSMYVEEPNLLVKFALSEFSREDTDFKIYFFYAGGRRMAAKFMGKVHEIINGDSNISQMSSITHYRGDYLNIISKQNNKRCLTFYSSTSSKNMRGSGCDILIVDMLNLHTIEFINGLIQPLAEFKNIMTRMSVTIRYYTNEMQILNTQNYISTFLSDYTLISEDVRNESKTHVTFLNEMEGVGSNILFDYAVSKILEGVEPLKIYILASGRCGEINSLCAVRSAVSDTKFMNLVEEYDLRQLYVHLKGNPNRSLHVLNENQLKEDSVCDILIMCDIYQDNQAFFEKAMVIMKNNNKNILIRTSIRSKGLLGRMYLVNANDHFSEVFSG